MVDIALVVDIAQVVDIVQVVDLVEDTVGSLMVGTVDIVEEDSLPCDAALQRLHDGLQHHGEVVHDEVGYDDPIAIHDALLLHDARNNTYRDL